MRTHKNKATLRFYEELNDFLPADKRKTRFDYYFWGKPSVKDVIESLNIPHTEVDLILINGQPEGFNAKIINGDDISVYPVFESFDISEVQRLRPKPLRNKKFICDVHLGKLTKLLRFAGFDVYYRNNLKDSEIINISIREKRVILTRDLGILKHKIVEHGYLIKNNLPEEQLREVISRFHLLNLLKPFTRCSICNTELQNISKEEIEEVLPPRVKSSINNFSFCRKCNKVYWEGCHHKKISALLEKLRVNK